MDDLNLSLWIVNVTYHWIFFIILWHDNQDEAVREVVDFMNTYSISQDDFDTIVELSKFKVALQQLDWSG